MKNFTRLKGWSLWMIVRAKYASKRGYKKMTEYHAYLLYEHGLKNEDDVILEILKGLSAEERKRIIKAASKLKSEGKINLITWRNLNFFARLRQIIELLFGAIACFY